VHLAGRQGSLRPAKSLSPQGSPSPQRIVVVFLRGPSALGGEKLF